MTEISEASRNLFTDACSFRGYDASQPAYMKLCEVGWKESSKDLELCHGGSAGIPGLSFGSVGLLESLAPSEENTLEPLHHISIS